MSGKEWTNSLRAFMTEFLTHECRPWRIPLVWVMLWMLWNGYICLQICLFGSCMDVTIIHRYDMLSVFLWGGIRLNIDPLNTFPNLIWLMDNSPTKWPHTTEYLCANAVHLQWLSCWVLPFLHFWRLSPTPLVCKFFWKAYPTTQKYPQLIHHWHN